MSQVQIGDYAGRRVHFVGAGGSSMSGLCRLAAGRGMIVSGSDRTRSKATDRLEGEGIPITIGHTAEAVHGVELLVYSAAIPEDFPERAEAARLGIPQMERAFFLGQLESEYETSIAVSGVHGKTSTTSMIACILMETRLDPTIHIGGELDNIGGNVRAGKGRVFLTEADEFHSSFLALHPSIAVVLNIDADHLDWYRDIDHIQDTFREFLSGMKANGAAIGWSGDPRVRSLLADCPGMGKRAVSYDLTDADYTAGDLTFDGRGRARFTILEHGEALCDVQLQVAGRHHALNALASAAAARMAGIGPEAISRGLAAFTGARRRFEHTADVQGVALYHDYGHNPTEVRSVIPVAMMQPHEKLWVVFQPHTYSRTKKLFDEFRTAFEGADEVLVTDIYGAREVDPGDIHATQVVESIRETGQACTYTPTFEDAKRYLFENWKPGDLVLTLGCGNINLLNDLLAE